MDELKRNGSGYHDPTAETAMRRYEVEHKRHEDLLEHIFYMCRMAGFSIENRIILRDKRTGKIWR